MAQNSEKQRTRKRGEGRRFQKGQPSPNPGGRPSVKWLRDFLSEAVGEGDDARPRRLNVAKALYLTAIDRKHRDHMRAQELLWSYDLGKPTQAIELSGPDGEPIETADRTARGLTSEQKLTLMGQLVAKALGDQEAKASPGAPQSAQEPRSEADAGPRRP